MSGLISEFALPNIAAQPYVITAGPDGALWFTEIVGNKIGRITTDGTITEFPLPSAGASVQGITVGPDGALWFTEALGKIGRITTDGSITEFALQHDATSITSGPDGALWFIEWARTRSGGSQRLVASLSSTWLRQMPAWQPSHANAFPVGITAGPDGALWFTEKNSVKIGLITTAGAFTEFTLPGGTSPFSITVGPDGAMWFAEYSKVGRAELPKGRTGVLSHIAAGGSWTTTITLVNTSVVAVPLTVAFRDDSGTALALPVKISQGGVTQALASASSVDATLQPKVTLRLTLGEILSDLSVGWAEVLSPGAVRGFAIFQTVGSDRASEGTVPLQTQFPSTMVLPFENADDFAMGVAMANLSATPATITATVWDEAGNQIGTTTLNPIPGNGHTSFVMPDQIGSTAGKRGIVLFQSSGTGGLAGLGLRFTNIQNTFTSVPTM